MYFIDILNFKESDKNPSYHKINSIEIIKFILSTDSEFLYYQNKESNSICTIIS